MTRECPTCKGYSYFFIGPLYLRKVQGLTVAEAMKKGHIVQVTCPTCKGKERIEVE